MNVEFFGYHTCKPKNGNEFILKNAPFLSEGNKRQWLGQGYYLWTDSDHYAHQWGYHGYNGDYVIVECHVVYEKSAIFDLVGNVQHQLLFEDLFKKYIKRIQQEQLKEPETVGGLIKFLRSGSSEEFPFHAVKIKDLPSDRTEYTIHYGKQSVMFMPERQQICFYADKIDPKNVFLNKNIFFESGQQLDASNEDTYYG